MILQKNTSQLDEKRGYNHPLKPFLSITSGLMALSMSSFAHDKLNHDQKLNIEINELDTIAVKQEKEIAELTKLVSELSDKQKDLHPAEKMFFSQVKDGLDSIPGNGLTLIAIGVAVYSTVVAQRKRPENNTGATVQGSKTENDTFAGGQRRREKSNAVAAAKKIQAENYFATSPEWGKDRLNPNKIYISKDPARGVNLSFTC